MKFKSIQHDFSPRIGLHDGQPRQARAESAGTANHVRLWTLGFALALCAMAVNHFLPVSGQSAGFSTSAARTALEIFLLCAVLLSESHGSTRLGWPVMSLLPLPLLWASVPQVAVPHPALTASLSLLLFAGLSIGVLAGFREQTRLFFAAAILYLMLFCAITHLPGRGPGVALLLFVAAGLYLRSVLHVTSGGRMLAAGLSGWGVLLASLAEAIPAWHASGWFVSAPLFLIAISVVFSAFEESLRGWIVFVQEPHRTVLRSLERVEAASKTPVPVTAGARRSRGQSRW